MGLPPVRAGVPGARLRGHVPRGHRTVALRPRGPDLHRRRARERALSERRAREPGSCPRPLLVAPRPRRNLPRPRRGRRGARVRGRGPLLEPLGLVLAARRVSRGARQGVRRHRPGLQPGEARGRRGGRGGRLGPVLREPGPPARRLLHPRRGDRACGLPDPDRRPHLAPDAPADRARQLAGAIRARRPVHHRHVVEDRADAALARRPRVRRQGRRVRALHGPAVAHPRDARGGARGRGAPRAHRRRGLAPARRARRVGHHGRLPRLPPRLARRVLDREERVRGAAQRLVLDPHGGLPGVREAGGGAGDRLVRPRAARAGTPRLHHRGGGGCRAGGHPRRLRPRLPARARGRRGALPRRGRVRAPPRRRAALGGSPASHGGCGERSEGARREPRGQMVARSSLLRRIAALAALTPRLVRFAHHGYPERLLVARIVLAGYLVRNPLGGYAWQAAHYLLGLRALGHDVWFYEDTGHYAPAYNPRTNEFGEVYAYGIAATADFLGRLGFGERWVFVDTVHGEEHGPGAGCAARLPRG